MRIVVEDNQGKEILRFDASKIPAIEDYISIRLKNKTEVRKVFYVRKDYDIIESSYGNKIFNENIIYYRVITTPV